MKLSKEWWEESRDGMGGAVANIITALDKEQSGGRRARYVRNLELFEGRKLAGYSAHTYNNYSMQDVQGEDSFEDDRLLLIRSAVCSADAEIYGKQKPKPQFQTLGATWSVRRKAYKLDRICEGILNQRQDRFINVWAFMEDAGMECALQGVACIKITADKKLKRIVHQLRPLPDVMVDPVEGRRPTNLFDREPMRMHKALKLYPKFSKQIQGAKPYDWYGGRGSAKHRTEKVIEVNNAYHLPEGPDEPGRFCTLIGSTVVDEGEWTAPTFPYVFLIWEYHRDGFWGSGIGDEGKRGAQECGELDYRLMKRQLTASGVRLYYTDGTIMNEDVTGNDEFTAVPVKPGAPLPQESVRIPFSELEIKFREAKKADFWEGLGLSQISAAARREQNINSAIGQITLNETKAGRQVQKAKRYEQAFVDLAHQYVWRLRELKKDDPNLVLSWSGRSLIQSIKFNDADPEDDAALTCSVAPASATPHDPAGRMETAHLLYQMGIISQEQFKELLGWADIENTMGYDTAPSDFFDALIDKYMDAEAETWTVNDYYAPEGHIPNKLSVLSKFTNALYRARVDQLSLEGEEAEKAEFCINLLDRFIKELVNLMKPPQAAAPPAQGMPPGAPMGAPGAPGPGGPGMPAAAQQTPAGALPQLAAPPRPGPPPLKAV